MKCKDCACWEERHDEPGFGFCKAHAPRPEILPIESGRKYQIIWPSTGKDDFCLQFKTKESLN